MPAYEYSCVACGRKFKKTMPLGEHERHPRPSCPRCRSQRVRQLPASFQAVTGRKT